MTRCYNISETLKDFDIKEIQNKLSLKEASMTPTVIYYGKKNQIWLFFFKSGYLKALWVYDVKQTNYKKVYVSSSITAACLYNDDLYVLDNNTIKRLW